MAIWQDPTLPKLATPSYEYLKTHPVRFGQYEVTMTPKQWDFAYCREKFPSAVGGVRSGKSWAGIFRALRLTLFIPGNRGIVGRQFQSDLELTTQRDLLEIAELTGLIKFKNDRRLVMYCCDPITGQVLKGKPTSEILFLHLDNPNHMKSHGVGWGWVEEAAEVEPKAFYRLVDRCSLKAAEGNYTVFATSNPEGRNWVWEKWFSEESALARTLDARTFHRGVHFTTKDNPHLTEDYLRNLYATAPEEWIRRYVDGEFDVFEGQIYKEFSHDIHCVKSRECPGWDGPQPPKHWGRYLGIDTGGADPWAFEFVAIDPWGNIVCYDEVYRPETYVRSFEKDLNPRMAGLEFVKIPMDSENKAAQEELKHMGVRVTNAIKRGKREGAINKLARYLHPNPTRQFPEWHPRAGEFGSPGIFFTENCPKLVSEIPQQRWREIRGQNGMLANEPDPKVADHGADALCYIIRLRPEPIALPKTILDRLALLAQYANPASAQYHMKVAIQKEKNARLKAKNWHGGILPPKWPERTWVN